MQYLTLVVVVLLVFFELPIIISLSLPSSLLQSTKVTTPQLEAHSGVFQSWQKGRASVGNNFINSVLDVILTMSRFYPNFYLIPSIKHKYIPRFKVDI